MTMLNEFHRNEKLVKGVNPSFIVLIPKKEEATELQDFRPISPIERIYKVISKVISILFKQGIGIEHFRFSVSFCGWTSNLGQYSNGE